MTRSVSIVIEHDEHGFYASCPNLPGCHTQGDTLSETMENIREAIDLYIETLSPEEVSDYLSKEVLTTSVVVESA